jgi:circadian clock protein KaiB
MDLRFNVDMIYQIGQSIIQNYPKLSKNLENKKNKVLSMQKKMKVKMYKLMLIVIGRTNNSQQAKKNLNKFLSGNKELFSDCKVEVVDILKRPEIAETEKIIATPTLIRKSPVPEKRMVGDLSKSEQLTDFIQV